MKNLEELTPKEKRRILARFVECLVADGYGIDFIFATPLGHFDYEKIVKRIHEIEGGSQMELSKDELFSID